MRWIIVSIAYILTFQNADAQSLMQNQTKYWAFRDSFLQKFIVVGEGQGKSLPAVSRHDNYERIGWGDATLHLGWYMAVLSTEYALLASNSDIRVDSSKVIEKNRLCSNSFMR